MDELHQIDVKVFAKQGDDIPPYEFVGVLQRWIQNHTLPGVLIDVADYSHMQNGPGVILVAHEHNVSVDYVGGNMGLLFHQKVAMDGTLEDRIRLCVKYALMAAEELQNEAEFQGRLTFDGTHLLIVANDRLRAPSEDAAIAQFQGQVRDVIGGIYDGEVSYALQGSDSRDRIAIEIQAANDHDLKALITQCSGQEVG